MGQMGRTFMMEIAKSEFSTATKIAVTGGTGFVGRAVVRQLCDAGYRQIIAISRNTSAALPAKDGLVYTSADMTSAADACRALAGCSAVIHLIGIIRPTARQSFYKAHVTATENVIYAMRKNGIKRLLHMSALGTRPASASFYHQTKWLAEQLIVKSDVHYTIIRPSLIIGEEGEFTGMLDSWSLGLAPPYISMPFFGRGILGLTSALIAPVRVEDVARLFQWSLDRSVSIGKVYELAGPRSFTWLEFLRLYAKTRHGKNRRTIGIPIWLAKILGRLPGLPFTRDQAIMAGEDNIISYDLLRTDMPDFFTRDTL